MLHTKGTVTHRSGVGRAIAGQTRTVATRIPEEIFMVVLWVCNVWRGSDGGAGRLGDGCGVMEEEG